MDIIIDRLQQESREKLATIYRERLERARKGRGFHNCTGFTKYLLGLADKETFIRPGDPSEKGLTRYLEQKSILPLDEFSEEEYQKRARESDAIALLHKYNRGNWMYSHFFVPDPDPNYPFQIFQRNGFEEERAELADVRDVITDDEYKGETIMVFFKRK